MEKTKVGVVGIDYTLWQALQGQATHGCLVTYKQLLLKLYLSESHIWLKFITVNGCSNFC